jgi:hypothetical protein
MWQPNIDGMDEQLARMDQRDIDTECSQMHLARQFIKYGKWAKFSKDPEFKKRCEKWRLMVAGMMGRPR